ncbi:MAG: TIGR04219 family outer membrane beta-barrel protein [Desulfobacterales bacterium]|nr:TIGR04219 family outer membrane beta-barrel protein [Desulfobacterales bacterium]
MKTNITILSLLLAILLCIPVTSYSLPLIDIEAAIGGQYQSFQGDIANNGESIDIENDLKYDDKMFLTARAKIGLPLFIPNVYVIALPMKFDGEGLKNINFQFGDTNFTGGESFYSELNINVYDVALFYELPLIKLATLGIIKIEAGLNARIMEADAKIDQVEFFSELSESKKITAAFPMLYLYAKVHPIEMFAVEAEARGVSYSGNSMYSLIGRVKLKFFGPIFAAGGLRYETIDIDRDDFKMKTSFIGPFIEAGFEF